MEKENKLNIKELVSLPITTYNDFYNVVSKNLKKFEQIIRNYLQKRFSEIDA